MEDTRIIELYKNRDENAIRESDAQYGHYCRSIAYQILKNMEDSEECVNDTWMRAWNAIPPTIPRVLKTYFGKIVRNLSLNRYEFMTAEKRGGTETMLVLEELKECISDKTCEGWSADRMVLTQVLNEFLGTLKAQNRIMFVKRYWYMESVKMIAEEMEVSESKVKMSLMRTRNKLADRLEKEGIVL